MKFIPSYFKVQELVPEDVYEKLGEHKALMLIDDRVLKTLDELRAYFGPCIVNNWHAGGIFEESGFRNADCECYSPTSQHSFGRAMDCKFTDATAEEARHTVIKKRTLFPWIRFIEDEVGWFHFDIRNETPIQLWSPTTGEVKRV